MLAPHHNRDSCHPKVFWIHDQVAVVIFEWVFDGERVSERFTIIEAFKLVNDGIRLEERATQQPSATDAVACV